MPLRHMVLYKRLKRVTVRLKKLFVDFGSHQRNRKQPWFMARTDFAIALPQPDGQIICDEVSYLQGSAAQFHVLWRDGQTKATTIYSFNSPLIHSWRRPCGLGPHKYWQCLVCRLARASMPSILSVAPTPRPRCHRQPSIAIPVLLAGMRHG